VCICLSLSFSSKCVCLRVRINCSQFNHTHAQTSETVKIPDFHVCETSETGKTPYFHICVCVYMHGCMYTCRCIEINVCVFKCIYVCVCVCAYVCVCVDVKPYPEQQHHKIFCLSPGPFLLLPFDFLLRLPVTLSENRVYSHNSNSFHPILCYIEWLCTWCLDIRSSPRQMTVTRPVLKTGTLKKS